MAIGGTKSVPSRFQGEYLLALLSSFIATTFIIGLEGFPHLISNETTSLMLESLRNATVGESYRVGGLNGDNLYPAYTNPVCHEAITVIELCRADVS